MTASKADGPQRVLECTGVERRFGGLVAVTGVDLHVDKGEIFGRRAQRQRQPR